MRLPVSRYQQIKITIGPSESTQPGVWGLKTARLLLYLVSLRHAEAENLFGTALTMMRNVFL
jgi:hypothetical protein